MCRACKNSLITNYLTSGLWQAAPSRRRFLACAVSAGAYAILTAGREVHAAESAEAIFRKDDLSDDARRASGQGARDRRRKGSRRRIGFRRLFPRAVEPELSTFRAASCSRHQGAEDTQKPVFALWHQILGGRLEPGRERGADEALPAHHRKKPSKTTGVSDGQAVSGDEGEASGGSEGNVAKPKVCQQNNHSQHQENWRAPSPVSTPTAEHQTAVFRRSHPTLRLVSRDALVLKHPDHDPAILGLALDVSSGATCLPCPWLPGPTCWSGECGLAAQGTRLRCWPAPGLASGSGRRANGRRISLYLNHIPRNSLGLLGQGQQFRFVLWVDRDLVVREQHRHLTQML